MLVLIRPGGKLFDVATLLPVGCVITYALFQIITRKYAGRDSAYTTRPHPRPFSPGEKGVYPYLLAASSACWVRRSVCCIAWPSF